MFDFIPDQLTVPDGFPFVTILKLEITFTIILNF